MRPRVRVWREFGRWTWTCPCCNWLGVRYMVFRYDEWWMAWRMANMHAEIEHPSLVDTNIR